MWLVLGFASAVFLGLYDVEKKRGLDNNAVIPVLFLNTVFCSLFFLPMLLLSTFAPRTLEGTILFVATVDLRTHVFILFKSLIVLISWGTAYVAIKHLPITIVGPIKSMQPALVLIGALLVFAEQLNGWQIAGIAVSIFCFFLYSIVGRREGISFLTNKWIWWLVVAVVTGAISGLYDKFLMNRFDRMAVQVWYTIYQIAMMLPVLFLGWYPQRKTSTPYQFRWSIVGIAVFLCLSDFMYFYALSLPGSMISIVSVVRRAAIIVSFLAGVYVFRDKNIRIKSFIMIGILLGMYLLYVGSTHH
ncbi:MAG TPA: EamA family transporter [Bacteroidota bacterium]|nr:EamA family transporter [Bacteroidota bacterium]